MLNIGPQELLLILVVALLVVGPRRLPELGRSLGKGLRELRKAQDEVRKTVQVTLEDDAVASAKPGPAAGRPTLPEDVEPDGDGPPAGPEVGAAGGATVGEVSKTLGRGLAEIRKAREEVQRSFRVDLGEPTARRGAAPPTPAQTTDPAPKAAPDPAPDEVDAPPRE
jgi:TatA/E family protein of Tat protein translocase